jgi:hypothetical protein
MATRDVLSVGTGTLVVQTEAFVSYLKRYFGRGISVGGVTPEHMAAELAELARLCGANLTERGTSRVYTEGALYECREQVVAIEAWRLDTLRCVETALKIEPSLHPELQATRGHLAERARYALTAAAWLDRVVPDLALRATSLRGHAAAAEVVAALDGAPALHSGLAALNTKAEALAAERRAHVAEGKRLRKALQAALRRLRLWWALADSRFGMPGFDLTYVAVQAAVAPRRSEDDAEAPPVEADGEGATPEAEAWVELGEED